MYTYTGIGLDLFYEPVPLAVVQRCIPELQKLLIEQTDNLTFFFLASIHDFLITKVQQTPLGKQFYGTDDDNFFVYNAYRIKAKVHKKYYEVLLSAITDAVGWLKFNPNHADVEEVKLLLSGYILVDQIYHHFIKEDIQMFEKLTADAGNRLIQRIERKFQEESNLGRESILEAILYIANNFYNQRII